tara:strand:+ start:385 stop:960 length:576 start_codon:yes stop_codon:yes gene_type:complete
VIDNYDSFTYNLVQYLLELEQEVETYRNDVVGVDEITSMQPEAIIISPGPCTPNEAGVSVEVIKELAGRVPILGVCLGHQCIGQAFGARIIRAPTLMHGKTSSIYHNGTDVYKGLEQPFEATRYHSLIVERETLPSVFQITSETEDGIIMGLSHQSHAIHGVQFHPESILTSSGKDLLQNFVDMYTSRDAK